MLKTLDSELLFIEIWLTNQNNKPLAIEEKVFMTLIVD